MLLKIGQLAKRAGLSVRALHHYDAIGLLSPSQRNEAGARLYGRDDLIRLHRIEALKQLACSLSDIKATLEAPGGESLAILRRQIDALNAQALQAQRLSQHLQRLLALICAGDDTVVADWLNTLELMNMYQKHLNEDDLKTLLDASPGSVQQTDAPWAALVEEVRVAMMQALPTDSPAAQALAWRWKQLVVCMTRNDPALANKLLAMQVSEKRAQDILGTTPAMFAWIAEAFVHARCALFAKYMSPAQAAEVRRRQFAPGHLDAWHPLVLELRAHMAAGTDPQAPAVQDIARRWEQLFRDTHCGDDGALEAKVRDAILQEPDLMMGFGLEDAVLSYLHQAREMIRLPQDGAGPKPSALMVAVQRAAHQWLEQPRVLDDPLAVPILGPQAQDLRKDLDSFRTPVALGMRSAVVVRSRLAEDEWAVARQQGVCQYVILGAGLDTSAYRHPQVPGRMFEVDLPATQAWKQARLREAAITVPASLSYVPVDFEQVSLAQGLADAGFDVRQPAYFSWLGVTMYLEEAAIFDTLRFIAGCAQGSQVLLEYVVPLESLAPFMRMAVGHLTAQLAARGEPWKTHFEPEALAKKVKELGFSRSRTWTPDELNQRYLADRTDGMRLGGAPGRLMQAWI